MNTVDLIIFIVCIFYFVRGWLKGFLRTIFGPISLIIGGIISYMYFKQTGSVVVSILIGLISPFILNFTLSLLIKAWQKATDEDKDSFTIGRLLGGIFGLIWGLSLATLIILLLILTPLQIPELKNTQDLIKQSQYYDLFNNYIPIEKKKEQVGLNTIQAILKDPAKIARFQESETFKELINDEKIKKIFSDEKTLENLKTNNISELIKNKDLMKIVTDEELTAKIMATYKEILKMEKTDNQGTFAPQ